MDIMEISGVSAKAYTTAAGAIEEEEVKEVDEKTAAEEAVAAGKTDGDKVMISQTDDFSETSVEEKASNYIQNLIATTLLTEDSKAQIINYLNNFDASKFIKSYGPFTTTAEVSAALYAVTSGMVKRQDEE